MSISIAVLIPCYNQPRHLFRAISSALWQLGPRDEIVVVDDGSSSDMDPDLVQRLGDRVLWLRNSVNRGVSYSRNRGIMRSGADWIKFLDADDVLAPFCLDLIRNPNASQPRIQVLSGGLYRIVNGTQYDYVHASESSIAQIKRGNPLLPSAVFARRTALIEVGLFDEEIDFEEDWDLWLRLHDHFGLEAFALTKHPVAYYWIDQSERNQKPRKYTRRGVPVREYFRDRYGVEGWDGD